MSGTLTECARDGWRVVFLSPHCDDVALSCGGVAALLPQGAGACITAFSAGPTSDAELTPLARGFHEAWGMPDAATVNEVRRAEEAQAMKTLGLQLRMLPYQDAIYRGGRYERGIVGPIHAAERQFHRELSAEVHRLLIEDAHEQERTVLVAPLAIGNHVDHRLLHAAAKDLEAGGWSVVYYEDYPYADPAQRARPTPLDPVASRLATLGYSRASARLAEPMYEWVDEGIETRVAAVQAYASQIRELFGDRLRVREALHRYAAWVAQQAGGPGGGAGRLAERYWALSQPR